MPSNTAPKPALTTLLDHQVSALDRLLGELRCGVRNQRHFDELEERAQAIAANIRRAFRSPNAMPPVASMR